MVFVCSSGQPYIALQEEYVGILALMCFCTAKDAAKRNLLGPAEGSEKSLTRRELFTHNNNTPGVSG
jgi:hypothetical protein